MLLKLKTEHLSIFINFYQFFYIDILRKPILILNVQKRQKFE